MNKFISRSTKSNRRPPFARKGGRRGGHIMPRRGSSEIPPIEAGILRIIPIGGVEQVGQNMTALEYGGDIIIVDAGFEFSKRDTPGIDYMIPNTKYLQERKAKIRGIFITHGHYDHIGAIPHVMEHIGNPPIYSREFGAMMILKRQEEFVSSPKINMNIVKPNEEIKISENFLVKTFAISHTIPDSMGLVIGTPLGEIAFIEDVRVDNIAGVPTEEEVEQYKRFAGKEMLMLTMDSTSIEKPGFSLSEQTVVKTLERIITGAPARIIIGTFASQVERVVAIIGLAEKYGRKVIIDGRSMKTNTEIARKLGLIKTKNLIPIEEMKDHPPNKILIIATGAQGEEYSVFDRIGNKVHRFITLVQGDTVLLSSSIIPGNDVSISKLKDNLYRSPAKIITYLDSDIHASGHGNKEELKWIHSQIKYRFFMPIHGHHYMLRQHADMAITLGVPPENVVVPDNGSIIEIYEGGQKIRMRKEKAPSNVVMVDGFSIGDTQEVVIRDRQALAQDGMFVIIAAVDSRTGRLKKSPDLISRGFVYLKESQELLHESRDIIKKTIEKEIGTGRGPMQIDFEYIRSAVTDNVSRFLFQKTNKRPLVIPVIISV